MTSVLLGAALANKPGNAGAAWTRVSWARAFAALGFDVHLVEQISRDACADGDGHRVPLAGSVNLSWFRRVTGDARLPATIVCDDGSRYGLPMDALRKLAVDALLVNISGHVTLPEVRDAVRASVYVDLDPGFTQVWEAQGLPGARLDGHDVYATVGANIGRSGCAVPTVGRRWIGVHQPVVLADWPWQPMTPGRRFTTVGSWRGAYGPVVHEAVTLGQKVHEFRRFATLPSRCGATFEAALDIDPADVRDRRLLESHGWRVVGPSHVAGTLEAFRDFVRRSTAEFSVAQSAYVTTRSGWFSDRSVRYLASGRPVLVQDTGWPAHVPAGEGALAFSTLDDAVSGVEAILADLERHAKAARALAEQLFVPEVALAPILEGAGVAA